jgi:2-oxoglutarate dehydrogenase E2 component (dihydrolipoamide succinyltransferase)
MSIELTIPEVGESISEVQIGEWLKAEGDYVTRNEEVVVIETDKATVEIPAPETGRVARILKKSGETAAVNEVIGYIEPQIDGQELQKKSFDKITEQAGQTNVERAERTPGQEETVGTKDARKNAAAAEISERSAAAKAEQQPSEAKEPSETAEKKRATEEPSEVREELNTNIKAPLEPLTPQPTEPEGTRHPRTVRPLQGAPGEARIREKNKPVPHEASRRSPTVEAREEESVPMTQLRRKIAERLVQAQQTAALLTTFNEIDMSAIIKMREQYREAFREKYEIRLGFMSFFVKAAVEGLKLVPEINAEIRGENILYRNYFDIGIAVGGGKGLAVPVLRNAERLSFAEIEQAIHDFARRAGESKLKPDELQGGTFTISNGGIYGSLLSTPIINPPQSGILGLHAIQDRPVVRDSAVVIRPMMYVALTYDHRIIDGREAVTFLKHIKDLIEDPARILLEL